MFQMFPLADFEVWPRTLYNTFVLETVNVRMVAEKNRNGVQAIEIAHPLHPAHRGGLQSIIDHPFVGDRSAFGLWWPSRW